MLLTVHLGRADRRSAVGVLGVVLTLNCGPREGIGGRGETAVALTPSAVFADDSLGWIIEVGLVANQLIALDGMLSPAVHVFDLATTRRLGSFGRKGEGPGEFRDAEQIVLGAAETADEVWILDGVLQRLSRLSLRGIEGDTARTLDTFQLSGPNAGSMVRVPDGRWFAGGWITEGRVARYHEDLEFDRTIVGFPQEAGEAPGITLFQAYESWIVADPDGGRLAAGTLLGGLLEIFDYDGVVLAEAEVPDPFQPAWLQGRSVSGKPLMSVGPDTRYGFIDLAATERYLYGIFSGRSVHDQPAPWLSREVQVYTWDGEYVKSLYLDRGVEAIAIDDSDTWLYAAGLEPSPWVGRFRLPEP